MNGFYARLVAILHKIRHPKHKLDWRYDSEEGYCAGDIVCLTCDLVFWCRALGYKIFNKGWE